VDPSFLAFLAFLAKWHCADAGFAMAAPGNSASGKTAGRGLFDESASLADRRPSPSTKRRPGSPNDRVAGPVAAFLLAFPDAGLFALSGD
jgi:hypothetical protein